jgi:hypothetical protein
MDSHGAEMGFSVPLPYIACVFIIQPFPFKPSIHTSHNTMFEHVLHAKYTKITSFLIN